MLHGKGLFYLIFLSAHLLIINVAGKTLLIETKDEDETQVVVAEGDKQKAFLKFKRSKVSDEPDSSEMAPDPEDLGIKIRAIEDSSPKGNDYRGDLSEVPKGWVKMMELLKEKCGNKEISNFCIRWRNKKWYNILNYKRLCPCVCLSVCLSHYVPS